MGVSNTLGCNVFFLNMVIYWHAAGCMTYILCLSNELWHAADCMNYGITCLSNGWNCVNTCLNGVSTRMNRMLEKKNVVHAYVMYWFEYVEC